MNRKTAQIAVDIRRAALLGSLLLLAAAAALRPAQAQELSPAELEDLVAPIALYPDDVLGIILPASTFPLDVVRAARFLDDRANDPTLEPDESWDDSIVALLNYPEVVHMMDADLDWTWKLGEAVLTDEAAVLQAAQDFRRVAYETGNLQSDDKQVVADSGDTIEIRPADPEVVYIPVYEPREVIVYHSRPIWHYYPYAYPVYYYPYPIGYSFGLGYFWGVTSYFSIGWHSHLLHVHHYTDRLHPYYLNSYYSYAPYYPRNHVHVTVSVNNYSNVWVPSPRRGDRPRTYTVESRTSSVRGARTITTERQPNLVDRPRSASQTRTAPLGGSASRSPTIRSSTTTPGATARGATTTPGSTPRNSTMRSSTVRNSETRPVQSPGVTPSQPRSVRTNPGTSSRDVAPRSGENAQGSNGSTQRSTTTRMTARPPASQSSGSGTSRSTGSTSSTTRNATGTPRMSAPDAGSGRIVSGGQRSTNRSSSPAQSAARSAPMRSAAPAPQRSQGTARSGGGGRSSSSSSRQRER